MAEHCAGGHRRLAYGCRHCLHLERDFSDAASEDEYRADEHNPRQAVLVSLSRGYNCGGSLGNVFPWLSNRTNRRMERQPDSGWRDFMDSFYLRALGRLGLGAPDRGRIWRATPDNLVSLARQLMGQRAGTLAYRRRRVSAAALTVRGNK